MAEINKYSYNLSLKVLKALGGNVDKEFESVDDIWNEINGVLDASGDGIQLEELYAHITENGTYVYEADTDTDGYVPVIIDVEIEGAGNLEFDNLKRSFNDIDWTETDVNAFLTTIRDTVDEAEDYRYHIHDMIAEAEEGAFLKNMHSEWAEKLRVLPRMEIPSKIKLTGAFTNFSKLQYVPESMTIKTAYCNDMFAYTQNLAKAPELTFTEANTNASGMFDSSGISGDVQFNCYNTNGNYKRLFNNCQNIKSANFIGGNNVSANITLESMFQDCYNLEVVDGIGNLSNVTDAIMAFAHCEKLNHVPAFEVRSDVTNCFEGCFNLVNFGGFINLGMGEEVHTEMCFMSCDSLSAQSYRNVINNLYDLTTKEDSIEQTLWLNMHAMELYDEGQLTDDDIAVATNKGWIVEYE